MLPWQPHNIAPHYLTLVSSFNYLFLEIDIPRFMICRHFQHIYDVINF